MGQVVFRLCNLRFVGRDPTMDLCPLVLQRFNNQRIIRAPYSSGWLRSWLDPKLVHLRHKSECLNKTLFSTLHEARQIIEAWRIDYNHERPHTSLNGLTPNEFASRSTVDHNQNVVYL